MLTGRALKLSTFKVGELVRGRKIGELFLKAAFRFATDNRCEHVFLHGDAQRHAYLFELLDDFGFQQSGTYRGDHVMVKEHPLMPPNVQLPPFEYVKRYYPHYRRDEEINKYVVPIQPQYHEILFPDYLSPSQAQMRLFRAPNSAGNAIKLAYLCHTPTKSVRSGDVMLFYRTGMIAR